MLKIQDLVQISEAVFEIAKIYRDDMRVPARIFVNEAMLSDLLEDNSLTQIVNVATLPGIQKYAFAMPDIHQGYGFPIGGVAALSTLEGVISPGGIGYDINCGVRLLALNVAAIDIGKHLDKLATALFEAVPSGVGRGGKVKLTSDELDNVLLFGAEHMVSAGYGTENDLEYCEEGGRMHEADPSAISIKAKQRGYHQLGTLGSGNHFLEVQQVAEIYNKEVARTFGLEEGMVTIMVHCGSRGLGHQTCTDYVKDMLPKLENWKLRLPDKELACAPFRSPEGQRYYQAMCASANFAWANRHLIGHWIRQTCKKVLGNSVEARTVYDVSHNIGKKEKHAVDGTIMELIVHRKGATRAFGPHHPETPAHYRATGHPVLIPGTMGTASYVLVGTDENSAFGSCCHGAGRKMSRMKAKVCVKGSALRQELEARGILVKCESDPGLAEEAPLAYKDVDAVVRVVEQAKLAQRVVRLTPLAVIKGG